MWFEDWSRETGILGTHPTTECGAVSVLCSPSHPLYRKLWALHDFKVSSVSGPVIWLVPVDKWCYTI